MKKNMNKKIAILLPFFNLPKSEIIIDQNTKITTTKFKEISKRYESYDLSEINLILGEIDQFLHKRFKKKTEFNESEWTIIEIDKTVKIPIICYKTILVLITSQWKYILNRRKNTKHKTPNYNFTAKTTNQFKKGLELAKNQRFQIGLQRWFDSYNRDNYLDSVLDCCSALEAVTDCKDELRLRIALSMDHILKKNKRESRIHVYNMYGIRNKFIHGSKIPKVNDNEQFNFIEIVSNVFKSIIKNGEMPKESELSQKIIHK
jgi:hypothetical protein